MASRCWEGDNQMNKWKYITHGINGNMELFGVNIFKFKWNPTGERVDVVGPLYKQTHKGSYVYTSDIAGNTCKFAAGEFSNFTYGFYVEE
jgi:hypothetical protein